MSTRRLIVAGGRRVGGRAGGGRSSGGNRAEQALNGLNPAYQFRADTVTLSAGNIATILNRKGADSLVMAAGTLAAPAADALFAGAPSIAFTGTQWLASDQAPSSWRFLHDGTGFEEISVCTFTSGAATGVYLTTRTNATGYTAYRATDQHKYFNVQNGAATVIGSATSANWGLNTATYAGSSYGTSSPIQATSFLNASAVDTKAELTAPNAGDPQVTLRLGSDGTNFTNMKWCETLIFTRVLTEYDRQIVREYIQARYGIVAPLWVGDNRSILQLVPFSWERADLFTSSVGKVLSWPDKGRPGHAFTQGTGGLQVNDPTADATLLNALSATFAGGQRYLSNLPALAWRFMHNGTGFESYDVLVPTNLGASTIVWSTTQPNPGAQLAILTTGINIIETTAASAAVSNLTDTGSAVLNARTVVRTSYGTAASPQATLKVNGRTELTSVELVTPSPGASSVSMTLGARTDGVIPLQARWGETLWFARVLSTAERAIVSGYLLNRYGGAP